MLHPSDSSLHTHEGQSAVLQLLKNKLQIIGELSEKEISLPENKLIRFKVDGVSESNKVLVEVYARIGKLHGAQKKKIGHDILKLSTIRKLHPDWTDAKLYIAFASLEAKESVSGWLRRAAEAWEVSLIDLPVDEGLREQLLAAQSKQKMVNLPADVVPVLSDTD
jgi:hypothetical protein